MTTFFSFDIRTVIWLLFLGNLFHVGILAAYKPKTERERPYRLFIAGKIFQSLAWALLAMRGQIPDLISIYLGNPLLFIGFALEAAALISSVEDSPRLESALSIVVVCGIVTFWLFGNDSSQRIQVATVVTIVLFATTSATMLLAPGSSRLRLALATINGLICLPLIFRTLVAMLSPQGMELLSANLAQTLTFVSIFLFMLLGGVGFLLQLKEQSDIELHATHQALISREALLKNIFETSSVAIFLLNKEGCVTLANRRMTEMFGCSLETLLGRPYVDLLAPADRDSARQAILALTEKKIVLHQLERQYFRPDGSQFWGLLTGTLMYGAHKDEQQMVGVISDISELKQAEERMRDMAQRDALTGVANRALFSDRLQQALANAQRDRTRFALLYLDLDHFKPVNDNFGHVAGDTLLKGVVQRILACVRESDTVARIGGDEFAILIRNIDTTSSVLNVAEKIRQSISQPFEIDQRLLTVSCCIGIAVCPDHGRDEIELSKCADDAMYQAKRAGRNKIKIAAPLERP